MKKLILSLAAVVITAGLITGCDSQTRTDSANRNNNSGSTVGTGTYKNDVAGTEYRKFRLDAEDQISQIDRDIQQIRKKIVSENMSNRDQLEDRVQKLEKKNDDLKKKLLDFKDDAADKRDKFRNDFNEDVSDLRQDVAAFWTNNNKDNRNDNTYNKNRGTGTNNNTDNTNTDNNNPGGR